MEEKEKTTEETPNTTKMLLEYFRQAKPSNEKGLYNTEMELHRSYSVRPRVDKNIHGPPYMIPWGEYEGGRQWC